MPRQALQSVRGGVLALVGLALVPICAEAQTTFVLDTFTGANNTLLSAHNPDTGSAGSWVKFSGTNNLKLFSNALRDTNALDLVAYKNTTAPTGGATQYVVGAAATWSGSSANDIVCMLARISGASNDTYAACVTSAASNNVTISKTISGTTTTLATGTLAITTGVAHNLVFSVQNASKTFDIDGTQIVSTADNSIAVAGVGGLAQEGNAAGDTVIDNFFESTFAATAVKLSSFTAKRYDNKVFLQWQTGYEVDNLGFHVYREDADVKARVNPSLIAGSALLVKGRTATSAGHHYGWWDADAATVNSTTKYWLVDVDLNGTTTWHGPVTPTAGGADVPDSVQSRLLNRLTKPSDAPARDNPKPHAAAAVDSHPAGSGNSDSHPTATVTASSGGGQPAKAAPSAVMAPPPTTPSGGAPAGFAGSSASALATQQSIAGSAALKVSVNAEGWYRVPRAALTAAGIKTDGNAGNLRLFANGVEQPYKLTADAIEFYGTGVDTAYTDARVYWLSAAGGPPHRVPVVSAGTTAAPTARAFPFTVEHKDREIYFAALLNGEKDNYFGEVITTDPTDVAMTLVHRDSSFTGLATLEVVLQGVSDLTDDPGGHHVTVKLNGLNVGSIDFAGMDNVSKTFLVPSTQLADGANVVTLTSTGGDADVSLVDTIRLTYAHTYMADGDRLRFTSAAGQPTTVGGFSSAAIRVVDVTDPAAAVELTGRVSASSDGFRVGFQAPGAGTRTLLAFTDANAWTPAAVAVNRPSSWADGRNAADYVIVTPADFMAAVAPLTALRASQGHRVAVVDIDDIYDEFSFGQKTPFALRDFVVRAHNAWRVAPKFVVLVGNATTDPRNYLGMNEPDWVPTKLVEATVFETASDDWFVDANGDGIPDLAAIGRLPARTVDQAAAMVQKTVAYESAAADGWTRAVALVADASGDGDLDFAASTTRVRAHLPPDYTVTKIVRADGATDAARSALFTAINAGQAIVHYAGHGSVQIWRDDLMTSDDVPGFTNGARLPVFVMMDCLNGFFQGLFPEESLAESLLRAPHGGAVAAWASSGFTEPAPQQPLAEAFYRLAFSGRNLTLGEVAAAAKAYTSDVDVRRTWIFFGDPALRLKGLPEAPVLTDPHGNDRAPASGGASSSAPPTGGVNAGTTTAAMAAAAVMPPTRLSDFDGDGRADILLTGPNGWRLVLSASGRIAGGAWPPGWEVYPANLNGDALADLVFFHRATGVWVQAINHGSAGFTTTAGTWDARFNVTVADFTGDGLDDVLLTDPATGVWFVAVNDGAGSFVYTSGQWPTAATVTVADFNGDGRADALLYDPSSGAWTLALADGTGHFAAISDVWTPGWTFRAANLDGNRSSDLIAYNATTGAFLECVAQASGGFTCNGGLWDAGLQVHLLANGGHDDELLYQPATGRWTVVLHQNGSIRRVSGAWAPHLTIATGDLDGDGRTDVVLYDAASGMSTVALNRGGQFQYAAGQWAPGWTIVGRP